MLNFNEIMSQTVKSTSGIVSELKAKLFTANTVEIYVLNKTRIPYPSDMLARLKNEYLDYCVQRLFGYNTGDKLVVINFSSYDFLLEINNSDITFWAKKICKELDAVSLTESIS